jgi:hypothetical protein
MIASDKKIETICDPSGRHRVTIYMRKDGSYGLYCEHYCPRDEFEEEGFFPSSNQGTTFIDTLKAARQEARGRLELGDSD